MERQPLQGSGGAVRAGPGGADRDTTTKAATGSTRLDDVPARGVTWPVLGKTATDGCETCSGGQDLHTGVATVKVKRSRVVHAAVFLGVHIGLPL